MAQIMFIITVQATIRQVKTKITNNLLVKNMNYCIPKSGIWKETQQTANTNWQPAADIYETNEAFTLQLHATGMQKSDFTIRIVENNVMIVEGEKAKPERNGTSFHRLESGYGKFKRAFYLPKSVQTQEIEASYVDGILTITLPKAPVFKTTITVS